MDSKSQKFEYVKKISEISSNTLFAWWIGKELNGKFLNFSAHRTFQDIINDEKPIVKFSLLKKESYYRTKIWNDRTDKFIFDFDEESLKNNLSWVREVVKQLKNIGINKYQVYLSGGKGIHLHFRYYIHDFMECRGCFSREDVRKAIFSLFDLQGMKIDETMFSTTQMIGIEGFRHRKTNNYKQRIKLTNNEYKILEKNINFEYLEKSYVNGFSESVKNNIRRNLEPKERPKKPISINFDKNKNYNQEKLEWHLNRFAEIYYNIRDGKKRILDCLCRYLFLTTKDADTTRFYLNLFMTKFNIKYISVDERLLRTKNSSEKYLSQGKKPGVFIYLDILTKEDFYVNYPFNIRGIKAGKTNERTQIKKNGNYK